MSFLELLLTVIVAMVVFGPQKLPMLIKHLRQGVSYWMHYKARWNQWYQQQVLQQQLDENSKKAQAADATYDR